MTSQNGRHSLNALPPGTVLHDYVVESELGSGGFSMVYLARHRLNSDWLFAIKEYLPGELVVRANDGTGVRPVNTESEEAFEDGLRRFRDEAEQLRRFRNERYIVSCLNYFEANGMPTPRLHAYPPETFVAEKFQAIVALGMMNSRMKDFFDLWAIAETFSLDGTVLAEAIRATFDRRQTVVPARAPIALTTAFVEDGTKQSQWRGFLRRTAIDMAPGPFAELQRKVAAFVVPPASAVASGTTFSRQWEAGGGWR